MERYILEALQKGVIVAVAASSLDPSNVKYAGRVFNPPDDGCWLEVIQISNNVTNEFWGSEKTHQGILRLILHCPIEDEGVYDYIDLLQVIVNYFNKGKKLSDTGSNVTLTITEVPDIKSVLEDPPEILIPASVRYSYVDM